MPEVEGPSLPGRPVICHEVQVAGQVLAGHLSGSHVRSDQDPSGTAGGVAFGNEVTTNKCR